MKAHITFEVEVSDIAGLLSRLGMADAPVTIEHGNSDTATRSRRSRSTQTEANDAPAQETPAPAEPRRRRSATVEQVSPVVPADVAAQTTEPSRRRRSSASEASEAPTISDIDLGKAASEAAESLTKLGDAGHQIVQDVLKEDFGVKMVNDLPADKRQAFLDELLNQVALAKADAAKA